MQIFILTIVYTVTICSVLGLLYALRSGKHGWAYVSAAIATPICLFVAGYPSLYYVPALFPIGIVLGAICIKRRRRGWAMVLFAPYLTLWLGIIVVVLINMGR